MSLTSRVNKRKERYQPGESIHSSSGFTGRAARRRLARAGFIGSAWPRTGRQIGARFRLLLTQLRNRLAEDHPLRRRRFVRLPGRDIVPAPQELHELGVFLASQISAD